MTVDPYAGPELRPPTTRHRTRSPRRLIDRLQRRLLAASTVGRGPFFPREVFPWIPALEAAAPAIRAELESAAARARPPAELPRHHARGRNHHRRRPRLEDFHVLWATG
ncbi:MAG: hypothetical protein RML12_01220 [Xanthomonadales bacterium]|nr:hypothetical protein [Xanthomonadales bacterium]